MSLRPGTFDDPSWLALDGHIWTKSAQPWFSYDSTDILCEGQPTDYVPFIEKFRKDVSLEH